MLDLDYKEDVEADVDMNVVMTGGGQFVEVQGTGEEATFSEAELTSLVALAKQGIRQLAAAQREALAPRGRFDAIRFGCDLPPFHTISRGFLLFL